MKLNNNLMLELRPISYSYYTVFKLKDVRKLLVVTFLRQMSGTICFMLKIHSTVPHDVWTYDAYLGGGLVSYLLIAIFADRVCGARKSWLPLYFCTIIAVAYQTICLFVSFFYDIEDNIWQEFIEGWIDNFTQFFFLFLAPIMIAYQHRHTHVITPAATIAQRTQCPIARWAKSRVINTDPTTIDHSHSYPGAYEKPTLTATTVAM